MINFMHYLLLLKSMVLSTIKILLYMEWIIQVLFLLDAWRLSKVIESYNYAVLQEINQCI